MKRFRWFLTVLVLALWIAPCAFADDGPMYDVGFGGAVRPMKSTSISMAAETVQLISYARFSEVRVDFRFHNPDATQTVLLGFPFDGMGSNTLYPGDRFVASASFRAWQDGQPLSVALEHGADELSPLDYYTHTVAFTPGDTTVTVDYLIAPYAEGWDDPSNLTTTSPPEAYDGLATADAHYSYILHTGALWKGPIGIAVVRWQTSRDFIGWGIAPAMEAQAETLDEPDSPDDPTSQVWILSAHILRSYTQPRPGTLQWVFRNFKPEIDTDAVQCPWDLDFHFYTPSTEADDNRGTRFALPKATGPSYSDGPNHYPATQLVDGDPSTAWAAPVGSSRRVTIRLPAEQPVRELRIVSGYAKRPELFAKYDRPHHLRIDFSDGTSKVVELADSPALQRFAVDAKARGVTVTVLDAYRGTVSHEVYCSEVELGAHPAPIFEEPAKLYDEASNVVASDLMPHTMPISPTYIATKTAQPVRPTRPAAPASPLPWVALGATLVGVCAFTWRMTP